MRRWWQNALVSISGHWIYTEIDPTRPVIGSFTVPSDKTFAVLADVDARGVETGGRFEQAALVMARDGLPWPTGFTPSLTLLK